MSNELRLTDRKRALIEKASQIVMDKMANEDMPLLLALCHPDVIDVMKCIYAEERMEGNDE